MQTLGAFSAQQKEYLEGFLRGLAPAGNPPSQGASTAPAAAPETGNGVETSPGRKARLAWLASGKRLSREEKIKHDSDPLDCWPRIEELSAQGRLPEGEDLYRFKTHGLWNVSPAQASMMSRLRVPGGVLASAQAMAIAKAADDFGGGYVDLTTRANLQIREIPARHMADLLTALHEAGITPRGSGADNIRNVTGNPTAGIDRHEFIDVLPLCRKLHHAILHDRTLYGLPRKFNVAFDGGNSISSLEDTNDIGLKAVMVDAPGVAEGVEAGVYFRLALGGITGHLDLARDTGFLLKPEECLPVIKAILQVYIEHGDRGNRKKSRLKYVLDGFGFAKFMALVQEKLAFPLRSFPLEKCRLAPAVDKGAHLGVHPQKQAGLSYVGVDVPVGRLSTAQLSGLAGLAARYGSGSMRLTVWQNLLIPDIAAYCLEEALETLKALGLSHEPDPIAAGLVACTGSEGCQFGQAPTKSTALAISAHLKGLKGRLALDTPVNIHLTGCPHSCAQHFIGDIGLIATKVEKDGYRGGGFHFFVGGGYGGEGRMAVAITRSVPVPEVPGEIERLLKVYLDRRVPGEGFTAFTARHADAGLPALFAIGTEAGPTVASEDAAAADPALDVAAGRRPGMNAPVLPESAPFTAEQRQWLNGFLAGMVNAAAGAALTGAPGAAAGPMASAGNSDTATPAAPAAPATRVLVLYGSQSGNTEGLAHGLADALKARLRGDGSPAFAPAVLGMDRFKEIDWAAESHILLATSTWGDGDMPDSAAPFWEWLKGPSAPSLAHVGYSVLGLGDRNYNRFCQAGKNLDARFAELGARRLVPCCECDTDYESRSSDWMTACAAALEAASGASASEAAVPHALPKINGFNGNNGVNGANSVKGGHGAAPGYGKKNPFPAPLLENHPLNAKGSAKDTRHISISLLGSGLEYKAGDALGVMPRNCYELVDRIILALNCLGNEKVAFEGGETAILRSALLGRCDLRRAAPKLLAHLREDSRNPGERRRLEDLAGDEAKAKAYLDDRDVLDVLEDFPHTRLEAQRLVETLGKLAPRLYSISSSPRENPGEVHLTVGIVRYRNEDDTRVRRGVASTFLAERVPLGMPVPVFVQPSSHFSLPDKPGVPIIMVGPGTGIAPFRAFLQERRCLGDTGKNWLFFGDQRRKYDFLYGEEFVAWQESGFLTRMDLAFSRDQEKKIYVQDRMLEQGKELFAWLEEGARFYVCGDAKRMAKDVETALLQVIAETSGKGPDFAREYLEGMKSSKRYLRDVY